MKWESFERWGWLYPTKRILNWCGHPPNQAKRILEQNNPGHDVQYLWFSTAWAPILIRYAVVWIHHRESSVSERCSSCHVWWGMRSAEWRTREFLGLHPHRILSNSFLSGHIRPNHFRHRSQPPGRSISRSMRQFQAEHGVRGNTNVGKLRAPLLSGGFASSQVPILRSRDRHGRLQHPTQYSLQRPPKQYIHPPRMLPQSHRSRLNTVTVGYARRGNEASQHLPIPGHRVSGSGRVNEWRRLPDQAIYGDGVWNGCLSVVF